MTIQDKIRINVASIELFNCYLYDDKEIELDSQSKLLDDGILVDKDVPGYIFSIIHSKYGDYMKKFNQSFHKSFGVVRDTSDYVLYKQQLLHYITTYGFELLNIYDDATVYIPTEQLDIFKDSTSPNITFRAIRGVTETQLKLMVNNLCMENIAFSEGTIANLIQMKEYISTSLLDNFNNVKNKELRVVLYKLLNVLPEDSTEFLRYLLNVTCNSTLLINNSVLYDRLRLLSNDERMKLYVLIQDYINKWEDDLGYRKLGEVFLKHRKLFINMKWKSDVSNSEQQIAKKQLNAIINKVRHHYADKYHKVVYNKFDVVNITNYLSQQTFNKNDEADLFFMFEYTTELKKQLSKLSVYKLISVYNGLSYTYDVYSNRGKSDTYYKVYKIRNGKLYTEKREYNEVLIQNLDKLKSIISYVLSIICNRVYEGFKDKDYKDIKIRIPECVDYACPTSEKMFIGNIPEGSIIQTNDIEDGIVFGVHWCNVDNTRVDLDLHASNAYSHIGWSGSYKCNKDNEIYFSGDMTDAPLPDGASECMYIRGKKPESYTVTLNRYNVHNIDVPYTLYFSKANREDVDKKHTFDLDKLVICCDNTLKAENNNVNIGQLLVDEDNIKFVFDCNSIDKGINLPSVDVIEGLIEYRKIKVRSQLTFRKLFKELNKIVEDKHFTIVDTHYCGDVDMDLSFNNLSKTTFIHILNGKGNK